MSGSKRTGYPVPVNVPHFRSESEIVGRATGRFCRAKRPLMVSAIGGGLEIGLQAPQVR